MGAWALYLWLIVLVILSGLFRPTTNEWAAPCKAHGGVTQVVPANPFTAVEQTVVCRDGSVHKVK